MRDIERPYKKYSFLSGCIALALIVGWWGCSNAINGHSVIASVQFVVSLGLFCLFLSQLVG